MLVLKDLEKATDRQMNQGADIDSENQTPKETALLPKPTNRNSGLARGASRQVKVTAPMQPISTLAKRVVEMALLNPIWQNLP